MLGPHAQAALSPHRDTVAAYAQIPAGLRAADLGLQAVAPGIGRLRGTPSAILAFSDAHPDVLLEVTPPSRGFLDKAGIYTNAIAARNATGIDGTGVVVGVVDTGLDVTHPDFRDATGRPASPGFSNLSLPPRGKYPDLEEMYGVHDSMGNLVGGAIFDQSDINGLLPKSSQLPTDEVGHGTHVTSIATGNGGPSTPPVSPYVGIAPGATIIFARITTDDTESVDNDDLVRGVQFVFNRADLMQLPAAVNVSFGSDFGSHDGLMMWEEALAANIGPTHPGHALVVAAGNSGAITDTTIHQTAYVAGGERVSVPIVTNGATSGGVQVWVSFRGTASLQVGLVSPQGEWISPVGPGVNQGFNATGLNAGVINGSTVSGSPVPGGSNGAVVVWEGTWPTGTYYVTLEGSGTADLYLQATGDAMGTDTSAPSQFASGVREGTVSIPATNPSIIGVGCTVSRTSWTSIDDGGVHLEVPLLDPAGGLPAPGGGVRDLVNGEVCWFSGAGPTVTGVPKPEIAAPGALIIGAMSKDALPTSPNSIFYNPDCPPLQKGNGPGDPDCTQIDSDHAIAQGTSMSAPMVTGAVALLFQRDPTLTEDTIVTLLQAGAHAIRGPVPFEDQSGPGELDVAGAFDAQDQMKTGGATLLPSPATSWLHLSADFAAADGSTPVVAILELRTADSAHRADLFDGTRLAAYAFIDGAPLPPPALVRHGPGVWVASITIGPDQGGSKLVVGATFDGADIVTPHSIPIATDPWSASYAAQAEGSGCSMAGGGAGSTPFSLFALLPALSFLARRSLSRRPRRSARPGAGCPSDRCRRPRSIRRASRRPRVPSS